MSSKRESIQTLFTQMLNSYRTSNFTNDHMISVFMGGLDNLGIFRADLTTPKVKPTETSLDRGYVTVDEEDSDYTTLYCKECEDILDTYDSPDLGFLARAFTSHWEAVHS